MLLLDEPLAGLNHAEASQQADTVAAVNAEGTTVVLVEHNMKAVMNTCDRISVLQFGRKIADAAPDQVINDEQVISAYLGHRFAQRHRGAGETAGASAPP